jgi:hypothetical protein
MLFDEVERTETRAKRERESSFLYLNSSARKPIAAAREVFELWFNGFPETGKADLRARFRSPIDAQHQSAFWELYLHELFSRLGFRLEVHPDVGGTPNHPDFLVYANDSPQFYLEAIVAGIPSSKEAGADARLAEVLDLVNKMEIRGWFLQVEYQGASDTQPSVKELRKKLDEWMNSLVEESIEATIKAEDWDSLPRFEWQHEGLTLSFTPSPRSPESAAKPDARPIGMIMGEPHQLNVDKDIRAAVLAKAKKYGTLPLPLIVAVNVLSEHCDEIDINNALFGTETVVFAENPVGGRFARPCRRLPDGVWFGTNGPRKTTVSAVLIGDRLDCYSCARRTPLLVHHPYPTHRLSFLSYPLPESIFDETTRTMSPKEGGAAKEILRLPDPWPPEGD